MTPFLHTLPEEHPLRNRPLEGARYRSRKLKGKTWREVLPSFKIARCSYNELGAAWTEHDDFAFPADVAPQIEV